MSGGKEGVAQNVDLSTGLARKVFRLLKSVNELEALVTPSDKSMPLQLMILGKSKNFLMATYLALDHLVWAGRIGIIKNKHAEFISRVSLYFFLGGCACSSISELHKVVSILAKYREHGKTEVNQKKLYASVLGFVKSSMDVVVAVGLLQLASKRVTPRVTGALGFITSLITCYELFKSTSSKVKIM